MINAVAADIFEQQRPRLLSLAYRMLGEIQAAEDSVQEGWLRSSAATLADIAAPTAWLTTQTANRVASWSWPRSVELALLWSLQ